MARRLVVIKMPMIFEATGVVIKDVIANGTFNKELFHLARLAYGHIRHLRAHKRIYPLPPRFREDTRGTLEGSLQSMIRDWIEANTVPCHYKDASLETDVKSRILKALDIDARVFAATFPNVGLTPRRQGKRHFTYVYPSATRPQAVKLCEG
jgi:hypothetical protein